jgi:hypothetical protein
MKNTIFLGASTISLISSILCCYFESRKYGFSKAEWFRYAHLIVPPWVFSGLVSAGEAASTLTLVTLWLTTFAILLVDRSDRACTKKTLATALLAPIIIVAFFK